MIDQRGDDGLERDPVQRVFGMRLIHGASRMIIQFARLAIFALHIGRIRPLRPIGPMRRRGASRTPEPNPQSQIRFLNSAAPHYPARHGIHR